MLRCADERDKWSRHGERSRATAAYNNAEKPRQHRPDQSGAGSLRLFINWDDLKGTPLKLVVASLIGTVMGTIGGTIGRLTINRKTRKPTRVRLRAG